MDEKITLLATEIPSQESEKVSNDDPRQNYLSIMQRFALGVSLKLKSVQVL